MRLSNLNTTTATTTTHVRLLVYSVVLILKVTNPFIHSCIHSFNHALIHTYIHICMHLYMHTLIHPLIHPSSIHPFIHLSIHPFIFHSSTHYPFIHTFINSSIHKLIHLFPLSPINNYGCQVDALRKETNLHIFARKLRHIDSEFVSVDGSQQVNLSDGVRQKTEARVTAVLDRLMQVCMYACGVCI